MATITITYDGRSKVAQSVIALIRSLDVFHISSPEKEKEREAFLCTSKTNMARIFADKI